MAKRLLILITICMLLLAAWTPDTAASGGVVLRGAANVSLLSPDELFAYTDEAIVYVARTGKKYHEAGCSHLTKSSIPVTLEQAQLEGKQPCSRCH
jgi:hypothetical protein